MHISHADRKRSAGYTFARLFLVAAFWEPYKHVYAVYVCVVACFWAPTVAGQQYVACSVSFRRQAVVIVRQPQCIIERIQSF